MFLPQTLLLLTTLCCMTSTVAAQTIPQSVQVPKVHTAMAAQLDAIRQQHGIGAMAWVQVEGDQIIDMGGAGFYSLAQRKPVDAYSLFRVGSLTKLLTALTLQPLVSEDKLSLDAPLHRYLPDTPLHNTHSQHMTLRMMLEHSSGLQDFTATEFNYPTPLSLQDAFAVEPEARTVQWPPGLHHSYSNVGAGYAGRVVEKLTGQTWDHYASQQILQPLSMLQSGTLYSPTLPLVTGYDRDRTSTIPYWHILFRPAGALNTSAADFSKLLRFLIQRGNSAIPAISAEQIEQLEYPHSTYAAQQGHRYGYGSGLYRWYREGKLLIGHGGDGDGYLAHFGYNPTSKRGFFVVINAFYHPGLQALRRPLEHWVVAPLPDPRPTLDAAYQPDAADLQALTGRWRADSNRFNGRNHMPEHVTLSYQGNQLTYQDGRRKTRLIPVAKNRFREHKDGAATHIFFQRQGQWFWQSDLGNYRRQQN